MRTLALIIFTLTFSGCVYGPVGLVRRPTMAENEAIDAQQAAWNAADLEPTDDCDDERPELIVAVARSHREMFSMTGYCGPSTPETRGTGYEGELRCMWGRARAAFTYTYKQGLWPFGLFTSRPTFVVWGDVDTQTMTRLVAHESIHWLRQCSGRPWDPEFPYDEDVDALLRRSQRDVE